VMAAFVAFGCGRTVPFDSFEAATDDETDAGTRAADPVAPGAGATGGSSAAGGSSGVPARSCTNGIRDGTEVGVDCGGGCNPCPACTSSQECDGALCLSGVCVACPPGQKVCGGLCVAPVAAIGCDLVDCAPCPVPPNSTSFCNGFGCDFECSAGFVRSGHVCALAAPPPIDAGPDAATGGITPACAANRCPD
jgi:hypothetical protein